MDTQKPIRHILVAHDLEATSDPALAYATGLARALGARITLFYAFELPTMGAPEVLVMATEWTKQIGLAARTRLDEVARHAREVSGMPVEAEVREGSPWRLLDALARERNVDLVVVGSHGRHGIPRAVLGSMAEQIVRTAPCPVLVVRGGASARSS